MDADREADVEGNGAPQEPRARSERPRPTPAPRRVLVVDDEPLVLSAITRSLGRHHQVVAASSVAEALACVDRGPAPDVVVCDLGLQGLSGIDLHVELAKRDPSLARRLLIMTGGALTERGREFLDGHGVATLEKPFTAAELLDRVNGVLGHDG